MRAGSRPGPSPAGGEEEGRGQKAASQEGGEEGGNRSPEEGERAAQEDRCPTAAEPEGEEVDVRLVWECVVYAGFYAQTEKAKLAEHHLPAILAAMRAPCP